MYGSYSLKTVSVTTIKAPVVLKIVYTNVNKTHKREEKGKQNYTSRINYHPHNHHHHDGNHQWRRHHQSPNCSVFTTKAACERIGAAIYVLQVFITTIIIIILTRPKPAFGRQGLAGSWGQDTDEVSTF